MGILVLKWAPASQLKIAVGVLLIVFSLYNLVRPKMPDLRHAARAADATIGILNGLLGGATGFAGILPVIWCSCRGWTRDEQRAVFQPTGVATFLMILLAFGGAGIITAEVVRLFVIGIPALIAGTALGWGLYGKLDEAAFRKVVFVLLLISGIAILASAW
jgi:uncharacterized membrane protein YfcA